MPRSVVEFDHLGDAVVAHLLLRGDPRHGSVEARAVGEVDEADRQYLAIVGDVPRRAIGPRPEMPKPLSGYQAVMKSA